MKGLCMKKIKSFESASHGFFIHLLDKEVALSVTPNEGTILLHEGSGRDRVNGFCIPGENVESFEVESDLFAGARILIKYKAKKHTTLRTHFVGETDDVLAAKRFAIEVNKLYTPEYRAMRKRQLLESTLATTPLDAELVSAFAREGITTCGDLICATSQRLIAIAGERSNQALEVRNMLARSAANL